MTDFYPITNFYFLGLEFYFYWCIIHIWFLSLKLDNGFSFFFFWPHHGTHGLLVSWQGSKPCPLQWECRVLTTGPPGSLVIMHIFFKKYQFWRERIFSYRIFCRIHPEGYTMMTTDRTCKAAENWFFRWFWYFPS